MLPNTQALSVKQGKMGEDLAEMLLIDADLEIVGRQVHVPGSGVITDFQVRTHDQVDIFVEVTWGIRKDTPGARRTDSLKKAVCDAWAIKEATGGQPYVLMSSHFSIKGVGKELLDLAISTELFDMVVDMNDPQSIKQLMELHAR